MIGDLNRSLRSRYLASVNNEKTSFESAGFLVSLKVSAAKSMESILRPGSNLNCDACFYAVVSLARLTNQRKGYN